MMSQIIYNHDTRYPPPVVFPPPEEIKGLPSQEEIDAYPRLFTWGELKEIIGTGDLEQLMRNTEMQARYEEWSAGVKATYGSTENYLTQARLPWGAVDQSPRPTYDISAAHTKDQAAKSSEGLTASTDPTIQKDTLAKASVAATPGLTGSGFYTPNSAGFVSLSALNSVNKKLNTQCHDEDVDEEAVYLRWDDAGFDSDSYAVLFNDWPYNVPYGVRHYCVWSRIPVAHPALVRDDQSAWEKIEQEGLGGFTGVTPVHPFQSGDAQYHPLTSTARPNKLESVVDRNWYAADVAFGGAEMRRWAGKEYECVGGQEVGKMVKALWDPRGWECLWFLNPPRLQSVPGFSHFHVFARRKTPEEIDAAEAHM